MKTTLLKFVFTLISVGPLLAQENIKGIVKDDFGVPVAGATVLIKGTSNYTFTDINGSFQIASNKNFPFSLQVNLVGYKPQEVDVYEVTEEDFEVTLKTDNLLDQIVVVGYGTQEKKDLVGSITKINAQEITQIPTGSFDAQMQGKAAGVQINLQSGIPGDAAVVRVRGATSINASIDPLYIIDGVFVNNKSLSTLDLGGKATSPLADINPSDIESIEVLKDATATAIYGSRGANGVIIITTKRGNYETTPKVTFNVSHGWAWAQKSRLWKLVTGSEHAELVNEQWINSGVDRPSLNQTHENRPFRPVDEVINNRPGRGLPAEQQTYDRISNIFRTAILQNYDVSLDGGTKTTKYYLGGSYSSQEAALKPANYQRASFKLNLDQRVNDKIQIGSSNSVTRSYRRQVRAGTGPNGGIFQAALHTPTYLPEYYEDGRPARWGGFDNADVLTEQLQLSTISLRYIGNLYADAELLPNLKFRTSWSVDYNNYKENEYNNDITQIGAARGGFAVVGLTQNSAWINEQTLHYKKTAGKHNFGALVGNTLQSNEIEVNRAEGSGFPNNSFTQISSSAVRTATQSWTKSNLTSFFSRVDYNFDGKYFIEFSARADGSSKFGANNKWGYFPSIGGAWRIKQEEFLSQSQLISDLKIRGSIGIIGNQNGIDDFSALGTWSGTGGYPDSPTSGDKPGTNPNSLSNPDLRWERTQQTDVGIDIGLLNEKILLSIDGYHKYTTDLLRPVPVPSVSGYSYYMANDGEISNKGIELTLSANLVNKNAFTWNTILNVASNRNKIEKLATPTVAGSRDMVRAEEGYSLYSFWMYKQLYVDPQTGDAVFEDVNGDGNITVADRQILGNALPKFFGGLTNNLTYGDFDLNVFFSFEYGTRKVSFDRILMEGGGVKDANRAILAYNLRRWQQPGDITDVPRVTSVGNNYLIEQNSRFIEDASFLRLRNITLGYTLPQRIASAINVKSLRVYANGTNLWLITKYLGPDPESNHTAEQNARGIDVGTPPQSQSVQLGINLTL